MEFLQSIYIIIAQRNSTNEQEEDEGDAMKSLLCKDLFFFNATSSVLCKQEKGRKLLLLLAILVASLTYQAGFWDKEDKAAADSLWQAYEHPYMSSRLSASSVQHRGRRMDFQIYNGTAFGSSLLFIMDFQYYNGTALGSSLAIIFWEKEDKAAADSLRQAHEHPYMSSQLFALEEFAAVGPWNVFILLLAAQVCMALQVPVSVRVGSVFLAKTCLTAHKLGARSKRLLVMISRTILDSLGNASTTGRRCRQVCTKFITSILYYRLANRWIRRGSGHEATWRLASGAMHHMTGNQRLLRSGSVRTESIALDDVWYVPGLDSNLVSTGQLARQGCAVTLGPGGCRITRAGVLVGSARLTEACHFQLDFLKVADDS